jgi:hypothetical protein
MVVTVFLDARAKRYGLRNTERDYTCDSLCYDCWNSLCRDLERSVHGDVDSNNRKSIYKSADAISATRGQLDYLLSYA